MSKQDAHNIIANQDYLPWDVVQQAKQLLGIKEQSAAEIFAEAMARIAAKK